MSQESTLQDIVPPSPGAFGNKVSTEQPNCQAGSAAPDDDLASWLDDFMAKPATTPIRRPAFVPPPVLFDAFVMFIESHECTGCGQHTFLRNYLSVRKPVKDGFIYVEYSADLEQTVAGLPHYTIQTDKIVDWCAGCWDGTPVPESAPVERFCPSRIETVRDLQFLRTRGTLTHKREQTPTSETSGA